MLKKTLLSVSVILSCLFLFGASVYAADAYEAVTTDYHFDGDSVCCLGTVSAPIDCHRLEYGMKYGTSLDNMEIVNSHYIDYNSEGLENQVISYYSEGEMPLIDRFYQAYIIDLTTSTEYVGEIKSLPKTEVDAQLEFGLEYETEKEGGAWYSFYAPEDGYYYCNVNGSVTEISYHFGSHVDSEYVNGLDFYEMHTVFLKKDDLMLIEVNRYLCSGSYSMCIKKNNNIVIEPSISDPTVSFAKGKTEICATISYPAKRNSTYRIGCTVIPLNSYTLFGMSVSSTTYAHQLDSEEKCFDITYMDILPGTTYHCKIYLTDESNDKTIESDLVKFTMPDTKIRANGNYSHIFDHDDLPLGTDHRWIEYTAAESGFLTIHVENSHLGTYSPFNDQLFFAGNSGTATVNGFINAGDTILIAMWPVWKNNNDLSISISLSKEWGMKYHIVGAVMEDRVTGRTFYEIPNEPFKLSINVRTFAGSSKDYLFVAMYDNNGKMIRTEILQTYTYSNGFSFIINNSNGEIAKIKVMIIDSKLGIPCCEAVEPTYFMLSDW